MRALQVRAYGEPGEVLEVADMPQPQAGPGQVRVRVLAAGLNLPDVNLCRGVYHLRPPLPFTPGMEACGEVVEVGEGADPGLLGRRVVGVPELPHGAFAEYALMPTRVLPVADAVDDVTAAATYIGLTTAHVTLVRRGALKPGEWLLVHAAAGGTGSACVQLGRALGARVIAVARGAQKEEVCRRLGAEVFVDSSSGDIVEQVRAVTDGRGAAVIVDPVGGEAFEQSRRCIAVDGRILVVGFASGEIPTLKLNSLLYGSYSVVGVYVGAYLRDADDLAYRADVYREVTDLLARGAVHPLITGELGLDQVAGALDDLAARKVIGKMVVRPGT